MSINNVFPCRNKQINKYQNIDFLNLYFPIFQKKRRK